MTIRTAEANDSFERLCTVAGIAAPALASARDQSRKRIEELRTLSSKIGTVDVSLVVFGSLARLECTSQSDLDWTLLVDGQSQPSHFSLVADVEELVTKAGFKRPGREGTFGGLISSHDLVHFIGGSDDHSANLTRRLLLLLESAPVGKDDAYGRTVRAVLSRYIKEDFGWMHGRNTSNVPRFLQNDIARFWRTMAVDFAYKRRDRGGEGWALRTAKLRMSRKLIYASGLAMCFGCAHDPDIAAIKPEKEGEQGAVQTMISFLDRHVRRTQKDNLAELLLPMPKLHEVSVRLFERYDAFIALIDDPEKRSHLESLKQANAHNDELYESVRKLSHEFQVALDEIFMSDALKELTLSYGIF